MTTQVNPKILHRIEHLEKTLKGYNDAYYGNAIAVVPDSTYDALNLELTVLYLAWFGEFPKTSVLYTVGYSRNSTLNKVPHEFPMLSLYTEVDYTIDGARAFDQRVKNFLADNNITTPVEYVPEYKFDGMSLRLKYVSGVLVQALTRGDGAVGEDVTGNTLMIQNIPKFIKDVDGSIPFVSGGEAFWVTGEVMVPVAMFHQVNEQRKAGNEQLFANPRNLAAGTMRQGNTQLVVDRGLIFMPYDVYSSDPTLLFDTHQANMAALRSLGFDQRGEEMFDTLLRDGAELYEVHMLVARIRASLPFEIDGMVYKVNDLRLRDALGFTAREPRWAVAHKYPPEQVSTVIESIDVQIGRTGKVTPMARFKPTFVGGVEVSNATLHSLHWMRKKGVHVGDNVIIQRAGDVVPELVMVTTSIAPWDDDKREEWQMPQTCPLCSSKITLSKDLKQARCEGGSACPGQVLQKLTHFCGRRAMNLVGIAEKTLETLLDAEIIKDSGDLMLLKKEDFLKLPGVKAKSAINMANAIAQARAPSLTRYVFALGIPSVGEVTAKDLLDRFGTVFGIMTATYEELLTANNVGPETAKQVYEWFHDQSNKDLLLKLEVHAGVSPRTHQKTSGGLNGMSFVVTGSFEIRGRDELEKWIQDQGGKVVGTLSKKTNYLVAGDGGGGKRDRAKELNIPIINEKQLYELARG